MNNSQVLKDFGFMLIRWSSAAKGWFIPLGHLPLLWKRCQNSKRTITFYLTNDHVESLFTSFFTCNSSRLVSCLDVGILIHPPRPSSICTLTLWPVLKQPHSQATQLTMRGPIGAGPASSFALISSQDWNQNLKTASALLFSEMENSNSFPYLWTVRCQIKKEKGTIYHPSFHGRELA